jgi:hypothetical protein
VRRYYQWRPGIGDNALRNEEQRIAALAADFAIGRARTYDNLKKNRARMPNERLPALSGQAFID